MKKLHLLTLVFLLIYLPIKAEKWAFLIGVGDYPAASGWNRLAADTDVVLIQGALLQHGFLDKNIMVLKNQEATKKGIVAAMQDFRKKIKAGDVVVFMFSGHGQRIVDVSGDEDDGFDEALVPFDAPAFYEKGKNEGQNHLSDDELGALFQAWRCRLGKNGQLVSIIDACYAGTAMRSEYNILSKYPLRILAEKTIGTDRVDTAYTEKTTNTTCLATELGVLIGFYATLPNETSQQIKLTNGQIVGPLCWAFAQALTEQKGGVTYRGLLNRMKNIMAQYVPSQHLVGEGNGLDKPVFNGLNPTALAHFEVTTTTDDKTVQINAGLLRGVAVGSKCVFYPAQTTDTTKAKPLAWGEVLEVFPQKAFVDIQKGTVLLKNSKAFIQTPMRQGWTAKVKLQTANAADSLFVQKELPNLTSENNWDLVLKIEKNTPQTWRWTLLLPENVVFTEGVANSLQELVGKVRCRLQSFEQARFLRPLEYEEEDLAVEVQFFKVKNDKAETQASTIFEDGDVFDMHIKNKSSKTVYVSLVDISPIHQAVLVFPNAAGDIREILPDKTLITRQSVAPPLGNEVLKVFVSTVPLDLQGIFHFYDASDNTCLLRGGNTGFKSDFPLIFNQLRQKKLSLLRGNATTEAIAISTVVFEIR